MSDLNFFTYRPLPHQLSPNIKSHNELFLQSAAMLLTEGRLLIQSLLVGLAISSAVWVLNYIVAFVAEWREKLNPPCDLPILNLKGWKFNEAKQEYVTRLDHYLEIGRSKYKESGYQVSIGWRLNSLPCRATKTAPGKASGFPKIR
jgi:hypothetical protein